MKATGIVRRVDDLGRVVIPKDIRHHLKIHEGDPLEIYVDNDSVVFQKYRSFDNRIVCDMVKNVLNHKQIKFMWYDNYSKISGNTKSEKFPKDVPEGWSTITEYTVINNIGVYPIIVYQTFIGCLATESTEYSEYVQGVVDMLINEMSR